MLAAEQSGTFHYKGGVNSRPLSETYSEQPETPLDNYTQRLQDISISAKDSVLKTSSATTSEKATTKPASSSRPLTIDDDDLDIDLEIDENIDTTVSCLILRVLFIPLYCTFAANFMQLIVSR